MDPTVLFWSRLQFAWTRTLHCILPQLPVDLKTRNPFREHTVLPTVVEIVVHDRLLERKGTP